jgi:glyoxylase-like metal-dependent hydrolase (beta-lactamase superfamily II)
MQLHVLNIPFTFGAQQNTIFPVLIETEHELVLVDCGYAGFLPLIEEAMKAAGLSPAKLTGVIITHHDIDHMGGLYELKQQYPAIKVYTLTEEAPYVNGSKKSLRLEQAEQLYNTLPVEQKIFADRFIALLNTMQPVEVDAVFADREEISFLQGITVLHTPGHMPWHISLYHAGTETLIAADALVAENDTLKIANPQFTIDMNAALETVRRFTRLSIRRVICYHGGEVTGYITAKLLDLLNQAPEAYPG